MLQYEGVQIPKLNCKFLTLELLMEKSNLHGVAGLLRALPHVETLNIDVKTMLFDNSHCQFELRHLVKGDDIDLQSWNSRFEFPNLKNLKIEVSSEECLKGHFKCFFDKLFKLLEFLIKNATVLEKFVIMTRRIKWFSCSMDCTSRFVFRLAEKLLGCTRSSTKSVIIFQEALDD